MKITSISRKRAIIITFSIVALIIVAVGVVTVEVFQAKIDKKSTTGVSKAAVTTTPEVTKLVVPKIHIAAMGDMLAHDSIIANAKTSSGYDFGQFFSNTRPAYTDADAVFCNQEGLSGGEAYGISGYPSFNAPTQFSAGLQSGAGCNIINVANNHMGDKGTAATNATLDVWSALKPYAISGANKSAEDQSHDVGYTTIKGIKIGFVSFSDFNNNKATPAYSVNIYHNEALVRQLVGEARQKADLVIVSMHWGTEDSSVVNADQQAQVVLLSSLGVDVIIGTGPHVLQKVQIVDRVDGGKTVVWYSLGNMLSTQLKTDELISGIAGFDVTKTDNKISLDNLTFIPTYMHYEWTAAEKASDDLLARKNVKLYLLKDATAPLSRSLLDTTVAVQQQRIADTLGPLVTINNK